VLPLPGPAPAGLVPTKKLTPRHAVTAWVLPVQPMTLTPPNVP
jgi:hypothetical protein